MRKIFRREVAAAVCCGKGGGAFSAKLLRGQPGHGFRSVGLDVTVRKMPVTPLRMTPTLLRSANCEGATCPRSPLLHMVL
jgi:hypothetical protein